MLQPGNKPKRPAPRLCVVERSVRLTPNMQRVTVTGDDLATFQTGSNGANIKLLFPEPGQDRAAFEDQLKAGRRPAVRTYTVRDFRPDARELDIDFVIHSDGGRASAWAQTCAPGSLIGVMGPSKKKFDQLTADWYVICADMSALPAASAVLEELPDNAAGHAFFEITDPADRQELKAPPGITITWLEHPDPHVSSRAQLEALRNLDWPDGDVSVFVAGEHEAVLAIRDFVLKDKNIPRQSTYISGYWKIGLVEDEHQAMKRGAFA